MGWLTTGAACGESVPVPDRRGVGIGAVRRGVTTGAGWAAAIALARVPPCHELLSTKSCSTFTLLTVTFVVWKTLSFTLAMMRYWPAGSGELVAAGSPRLGRKHLAGLEIDCVDLNSALALTRLIEVGAAVVVVGDADQLRLRSWSCGRSPG